LKRIITAIVGCLFLALATPAYALNSLTDARFDSVRLTSNGSVRVAVEYSCPDGQNFEAVAWPESFLVVYQQGGSGIPVYDQTFQGSIVCNGDTQTLVRRFPPPPGEKWDPRLRTHVELRLTVRSADQSPQTLRVFRADTFSLHGVEEATRRVDIHVTRARLIDDKLVVAVSYRCPEGWFVDVEDDDDWAYLYGRQDLTDTGEGFAFWLPLGNDITCDGTANSVVKRVRDATQAGFDPQLPLQIETLIDVVKRGTWAGYLMSDEDLALLVS
jgi:hypothetical protein